MRESSDFAYFSYIPQNQWEAGVDETSACGWIDLNNEADPRYSIFRTAYAGTNDLYDLNIIRITGYMDGSRIEPLAMAFPHLGRTITLWMRPAPDGILRASRAVRK